MTQCAASFNLDHAVDEPWPAGNWQCCRNEGVKTQFRPG